MELVVKPGALSSERVLNVLVRPNAKPIPETVETTLQLQDAPVANTTGYDSLRAVTEVGHAA